MTQNNSQVTLDHHKLTESSRHFSSAILKNLNEDRRTVHTERINNKKDLVVLKSNDVVMDRLVI